MPAILPAILALATVVTNTRTPQRGGAASVIFDLTFSNRVLYLSN